MATYYTSQYSGEELDEAVRIINELTAVKTIAELLAIIEDLQNRVTSLEGGA